MDLVYLKDTKMEEDDLKNEKDTFEEAFKEIFGEDE